MSVTIKDIAERAGVSFSTVSKALRNSPLVQEKTKRKILEIAESMGYQPNIAARSLVSKKSWTVGVVWPSVERATPAFLITKINELLEQNDYTTLLSINQIESAIEAFHRIQVDAILIFQERDQLYKEPTRFATNIPILVYGVAGSNAYPTLDVKRGQAIELAVRHLAELGHKRIAYIGEVPYVDLLQDEKAERFKAAMRALGLADMTLGISGMESHDGFVAAKHALSYIEPRPTAIIGGSYDLTRGIIRAAGELQLRIPEDLSIVSYDNIDKMNALEIPVTAVGADVGMIARRISETLLSLIDEGAAPETVYLDPELAVRASTAAPRM